MSAAEIEFTNFVCCFLYSIILVVNIENTMRKFDHVITD